jgi:carboxylate-amine ligase
MVLLADARSGVPTLRTQDSELREQHGQAAALGPAGAWTHPLSGRPMPLSDCVQALVEHARSALEMLDEMYLLQQLLQRLADRGTGAARQRPAYRRRGRLEDVVDDLAAPTIRA